MKLFKFTILTILLLFVFNTSRAQLGVSYHQYFDNNFNTLIGLNYEINQFRPEFRFGINRILEEITLEFNLNYQFIQTTNFNFYSGLGYNRDLGTNSLVLPIGLNIYPFEEKQFGFLIELKPTFSGDFNNSLRGSIGIQYQFNLEKK